MILKLFLLIKNLKVKKMLKKMQIINLEENSNLKRKKLKKTLLKTRKGKRKKIMHHKDLMKTQEVLK